LKHFNSFFPYLLTTSNLGRSRSGSRGKRNNSSTASGRSRSGSRNRNANNNNSATADATAPPQDAFAAFLKAQGSGSGGRDSSVGSQGRRNSTGTPGALGIRVAAPDIMGENARRDEDEQNTRDGSLDRFGGAGGSGGPEPLNGLDDVHVGGKVRETNNGMMIMTLRIIMVAFFLSYYTHA